MDWSRQGENEMGWAGLGQPLCVRGVLKTRSHGLGSPLAWHPSSAEGAVRLLDLRTKFGLGHCSDPEFLEM